MCSFEKEPGDYKRTVGYIPFLGTGNKYELRSGKSYEKQWIE